MIKRILRKMLFRDAQWRAWRFHWGRPDWSKEVGDPAESSLVAAILLWIGRTFPEAPPMLEQIGTDGVDEMVRDHRMLRLLQKPNDYYTGVELWMATTVDWAANGDAYWLVIPSASGMPVRLWWVPSWMMEPRGTADEYLTHYDYTVDGDVTALDPRYVVHFRYGLDPENDRKGCSPLKSVLREVFTDNEAATFTATLLRNMGVPGIVVSPDSAGATIDPGDAEETKKKLMAEFTGQHRGEPIVMSGATKVSQYGFSPEQLLLRELRRIPEERVSAVTGIPAIVVGFGAGLERSTFTNMGEARQAAYEAGLIPMQRILGEKIRFDLLPLFGEDPFKWRFLFDLSKVRVFQEDLYKLAQRLNVAINGGWARVSEGRRQMGWPVAADGSDDIYLRQSNVTQVPADGGAPQSLAPAGQAPTNGNGNGSGQAHGYTPSQVADEVIAALRRHELEGATP